MNEIERKWMKMKMLTQERFGKILEILENKGSATVAELMLALGASESTVRRDLNTLNAEGRLLKVHGGAMKKGGGYHTQDIEVELRKERNKEQKVMIAQYAAACVACDDIVYMDAGTTTELMIDSQLCKDAVYVTNAVGHAKKLSHLGCKVYLLGGEFKGMTDAIVGEEAMLCVEKYNFTKGFFGTNGLTKKQGFTTPELKEALMKSKAMEQCKEVFVLADDSKFGVISSVTFGQMEDATVLTNRIPDEFKTFQNIREVEK